jgi:hypothetical protein
LFGRLLLTAALLLLADCSIESSPMLKGMVSSRDKALKIVTPETTRLCESEVRKVLPQFKLLGSFGFSVEAASRLSQRDWSIWSDDLVLMVAPVGVRGFGDNTAQGRIGCTFKVTDGNMTFVKAYTPQDLYVPPVMIVR